jgi:hypothetical protein
MCLPDNLYKVSNKKELSTAINKYIRIFGNHCNLNWIDVSDITDMS